MTLEDGYELTLSGEMTVGGALGEGQFRVGLFDAPDPLVATGGDGYVGFMHLSRVCSSKMVLVILCTLLREE
ncbi:hypothetical protein GCM10020366_11240 [Saccharopolyspora gregorii]|uniref:Uncharacterized protein n=1 Tax=Saccharopolyspora gregorii TaxID=33914 RepID=A0ABP6RJP2_9PSEU